MTSPAIRSPFYVVAHRGDSDHAPENTMPSFEAALAKGADEIECDVRVTRDGVPVVIHDASTRRTTGIEANVAELTLSEIRELDAGSYRGPAYAGTSIPTLDELLDTFLTRIPLQIELKAAAATALTVEALRKRAAAGSFARVMLTSFQREYIVEALRLEPRVRIGLLLESSSNMTPAEVRALGIHSYMPNGSRLTAEIVDQAHALELSVRAWGVKTLQTAQHVVATGADGATYNDPAQLLAWLKESGRRTHALPLKPMASLRS
jgi:glycerophosphoryl diester phosphodiesterase